jgi:high affinity sulfate transporter 1
MTPIRAKEQAQLSSLKRYIPLLAWLPSYRRAWLRIDVLAGISAWGITVPTSMGFAQMAGLPVQAGLYASMVALVAYAVLGTSSVLKVKTSPSMAVMSAAVVAPLALGDYAYYVTLSAALALVIGLILIGAGLARMGFLADMLAKSVVTGFLFGLAMLIIISQLPDLFGLPSASGSAPNQLWQLSTSLGETNPWTLAISLVSFFILLLFRRYAPTLPGALVVIVLSILVVTVLNLEELGVALVGPIPTGLPAPRIPLVRPSDLPFLLLGATAMVFVALGESLGTARTLAIERRNRSIDTDQELLALGVANLGAGLMRGFAVGGNPPATVSANESRTKTQVASIVTAMLILGTYVTEREILSNLPQAVVAVAVILSASHLLNLAELRRFYRSRKIDFGLSLVTLVGVFVTGVLPGLMIAVFLSLLIVLYQSSRPHLAVLGKIPGHRAYGDIYDNPDAEQIPGLLIVRPDVPLFFANAHTLHGQISSVVSTAPGPVRAVIIDLGASADLDIACTDMLSNLLDELHQADIRLLLVNAKSATRSRLEHTGLIERIGEENLYLGVPEAVDDVTRT